MYSDLAGIPSSTLYKIARREGIRLAAPFNAAPVAWRRGDLQRALAAIRAGRASVQRAASHYGIPTGNYIRAGRASVHQAASHYGIPTANYKLADNFEDSLTLIQQNWSTI
ncbi:putative Pipsqueak, partial [Operophtera brumata]